MAEDGRLVRVGTWVPVTRQALADADAARRHDADVARVLRGALDRRLRPWRYPDRNPMPPLVLFPRLARLGAAAARINLRAALLGTTEEEKGG